MSSTNATSNDSKPKEDAPASAAAAAHGGGNDGESAKAPATVTKTVQTVEVKESAGQDQVLKPTKVVHQIPVDQAKQTAKQD